MRELLLLTMVLMGLFAPPLAQAAAKPNIVILYADDLGWGELGCQGKTSDIPTPHIDSLATNGIRCTQGYVAATYCSPSRAGLMTGRYPTRFGHEFNSVAEQSGLALTETTIANRLKELDYATCCIGKWHLGRKPEYLPTSRGFDEFYGTLGNSPFFNPRQFVDSRVSKDTQPVNDDSFYTTDAYAQRAVDWLGRQNEKPWFLYLPFNAQHAPLQAPQKYLDRFSSIQDENRRIFAAMLSSMDDAVGQVLTKIRTMGQEENTLIFFVADNGGPTKTTTSQNGGLRGFKMNTYEGGPRVPFLVQWKSQLPAGKTYDLPVINLDIMPTVVQAAGGVVQASAAVDGVDLLPYLKGEKTSRPHDTLYWRCGNQWAVRQGDMKLVQSNGGGKSPELYDLSQDVAEQTNLATTKPQVAQELQTKWDAWSSQQQAASAPQEKPKNNAPSAGAAKKPKKKKKQQAASNNP